MDSRNLSKQVAKGRLEQAVDVRIRERREQLCLSNRELAHISHIRAQRVTVG